MVGPARNLVSLNLLAELENRLRSWFLEIRGKDTPSCPLTSTESGKMLGGEPLLMGRFEGSGGRTSEMLHGLEEEQGRVKTAPDP